MNVVAFLYAATIIVGAISSGHGRHYNYINYFNLKYGVKKMKKSRKKNQY